MKRTKADPAPDVDPGDDALLRALGGKLSVAIAAAHALYHELGALPNGAATRAAMVRAAGKLDGTVGDAAGDRRAAAILVKHAVTASAPKALLGAGQRFRALQLEPLDLTTPAEALAALRWLPKLDDPADAVPGLDERGAIALRAAREAADAFARGDLMGVAVAAVQAALAAYGPPEALGIFNAAWKSYGAARA